MARHGRSFPVRPIAKQWLAGPASPVTLVDITPTIVVNGQTGVVITGTDFGATQGLGDVIFSPTDDIDDVDAEVQTVTAWADTSVTVTVVAGGLPGGTIYVFVRNNGGDSNTSGLAFTLVIVTLGGTLGDGATEAQIVSGGQVLTLTLTGSTWIQ